MNSNLNVLNAVLLLFGCVMLLIIMLPAVLARLYDIKATKSARPPEGNMYPTLQTGWLFTRAGIIASVVVFLAIPPLLFMSKYFITEWFDIHRTNDTRHMVLDILVCIGSILVSLGFRLGYIDNFKTHKDDYVHLTSEEIEFRDGNKKVNMPLNKIKKFEKGRRGYKLHVENGEMILISYKFINSLIGNNELKAKLKELVSSLY